MLLPLLIKWCLLCHLHSIVNCKGTNRYIRKISKSEKFTIGIYWFMQFLVIPFISSIDFVSKNDLLLAWKHFLQTSIMRVCVLLLLLLLLLLSCVCVCACCISFHCRSMTISLMDSANIVCPPLVVHYVMSGSTEMGHANWPLVYQAHLNFCTGSAILWH